VLSGLIALVAVAAVIGLLGGVAVLIGSKAVGLGGESSASSAEASTGRTLYLPEPTITSETPETPTESAPSSPTSSATTTKAADAITLSAGQTSVSPMQQIDLTGVYAQGEGAILQVQRFEGGAWINFPVTTSVSNQTFSTYVQTGRTGENKWRVVDTDKDVISNEVVVTVG